MILFVIFSHAHTLAHAVRGKQQQRANAPVRFYGWCHDCVALFLFRCQVATLPTANWITSILLLYNWSFGHDFRLRSKTILFRLFYAFNSSIANAKHKKIEVNFNRANGMRNEQHSTRPHLERQRWTERRNVSETEKKKQIIWKWWHVSETKKKHTDWCAILGLNAQRRLFF